MLRLTQMVRTRRILASGVTSVFIIGAALGLGHAQTPAPADQAPASDASRFGPTKSAPGTKVYFIGLQDGQSVPAKFTVRFGLKGMGVAPAGTDRGNTGHHHLLIDTELPALNEPIPNDFNHLHFGAGQTEGEVELTPGNHTLQLILGDKDHISFNPPVVSDRITVHVGDTEASESADSGGGAYKRRASPPNAHVYFEAPVTGAVVPSTFTVKFGLVGMGVAPAGLAKAYTGHHHLLIDTELPPLDQPIPNDFNHYHFGLGQTEAQISLPPGPHTLQLLLADSNHVPHDPAVYSKPIKIVVGTPHPKKRHHR